MRSFLTPVLLLILPIILFGIEVFKINYAPPYHWSTPDPSYIYLFNGINVADGNWEIGHYDNPGTPLHILAGYCIWLIHLFSELGNDVVTDVLSKPEYYIFWVTIILSIIKALILFVGAWHIFKSFKSTYVALLYQCIPFLILFRITGFTTTNPDQLLDSVYLVFIALTASQFWKLYQGKSLTQSSILGVGIILGLAIATKFTSISLLIIPIFLCSTLKSRAWLLGSTVGSFFVFTIPIWSRLGEFASFIIGIATHDGKYGTGKKNLINTESLFDNIAKALTIEYSIIIGIIVLVIALTMTILNKQKLSNFLIRVITGVLFTYVVQLIIVGKHYELHYTLPIQYLTIPSIGIAILTIFWFFPKLFKVQYVSPMLLAMVVLVSGCRIGNIGKLGKFSPLNFRETVGFIEQNKKPDTPLLLFSGTVLAFHSSCLPQQGLRFGKVYAGYITRWERIAQLKIIYPNTYFFNRKTNRCENWIGNIPFWKIMHEHSVFWVYSRSKTKQEIRNIILHKLNNSLISIEEVFLNKTTGERVFKLKIDAEIISKKFSVSITKLNRGKSLTLAKHTKLPIQTIEIKMGNYIEITAWRKKTTTPSFIELKNNRFQLHQGVVIESNNESEKIFINFKVPNNFDDSLTISLRNIGNESVEFSDLELIKWEDKK
ncbi:MAG: hypothetical protein JKY53_01440 [Flavobacteriales bacterium]|nr:hypothetical protein [Flavobacteriales bacterium]